MHPALSRTSIKPSLFVTLPPSLACRKRLSVDWILAHGVDHKTWAGGLLG
jgi:hypothetical protein